MRNRLLIAALVVAAFVAETKLRLFGTAPNLTVLIVYAIGLRHGHLKGMGAGAVIGALGDAVAGNILGPGMLSKATVGYLACLLKEGVFIWTPVLGAIGAAFFTLLDGTIAFGSEALFTGLAAGGRAFGAAMLWQAGMNAVAGIFITAKGREDERA
jgi:rod shape-determining protein MreD